MKQVLLLLAKGFEEYEACVFTDVMGWSRSDGDVSVGLTVAALRPRIKGTWNLTVVPEILVKDVRVEDYDALAIPGGFEEAGFYEDAYHDDFLNLIRAFHGAGKIVASICVGALPVGKSGILKDRFGTTYHGEGSPRRRQLGELGVRVRDEHIVVEENIITSSCPATAIHVAYLLLEMLTGKENVQSVKRGMGFDMETLAIKRSGSNEEKTETRNIPV